MNTKQESYPVPKQLSFFDNHQQADTQQGNTWQDDTQQDNTWQDDVRQENEAEDMIQRLMKRIKNKR